MKLSDSIAFISLIVSTFAFLASTYPHIMDWKRNRRKSITYFKRIITSTKWTNEGDIYFSPKSHFDLSFLEVPGRTNVYAELIVNGDESATLRGKIKPDGSMTLTLNITVGWREIPSAEIELSYDEDEDLLNYRFKHYLGQHGLNDDLSRFDFSGMLWRNTLELDYPDHLGKMPPS
ncbi:hypothetical protein AHT45_12890 [Salmonella enterica subsp. enterica serovar Paratyphi B]|nr:hypothetical protein [Salmonella enterica subsp. enterica serovar Paratyphi B]EHJ6506494.1 hypothetical protein [Salmonella enterica subsp. enterica serovar Java]